MPITRVNGESAMAAGQLAETSRRERLRRSTQAEILDTARALLVDEGAAAVSLRAIARRMGMTAPGLYRYYASHELLVESLVAALYAEVAGSLERVRDALPAEDVSARLIATAREFRRWAQVHPAEFGLLFGTPVPGYASTDQGEAEEQGRRFGGVFLGLFADLWARHPFPVPADDELDEGLKTELRAWLPEGRPIPLGAVFVFLRSWMRLYGAVTMEVFGHLHFAVLDASPLFEAELRGLAELIGIGDAHTVSPV